MLSVCSPPELSPSAKQGLSVFVNTLDLPDSWEMGLKLKALALKCSWCLAAADKVGCSTAHFT